MTKNTISIIKTVGISLITRKSMSFTFLSFGIFSYTQSISHDIQIKYTKTLNETRNL